jgi:hypothetical protein
LRRWVDLNPHDLNSADSPTCDLRPVDLQYGGVVTGPLKDVVADLRGYRQFGGVTCPHVGQSSGLEVAFEPGCSGLTVCVFEEDGERVFLVVSAPRDV